MSLFARWQDVAWDATRWPHFRPQELACKCARYCRGEYFHDPHFLDALETFRAVMAAPLRITSGRRCALHNAAIGGAPLSMHKQTLAADISLAGHDCRALALAAIAAGFTGIGYGRSFLHVDRRARPAAWFYPRSRPLWAAPLAEGGLPCPR